MLKIADLLTVSTDHVDHERVRRYAESLDSMPPVVVFRTPQGLLLADGYHRVAAARLLGRTTIEAEIREGDARDALTFAVEHTVASGIPRDVAEAAIQRRMSQ